MIDDFDLDLEGWLKIPRSIIQEPSWKDRPWTKGQVLIALLTQTTFKARRTIERSGKKMILVRGQAFIKKKSFAELCGWNRPKLERFLRGLEKPAGDRFAIEQEIVRNSSNNPKERPAAIGTIITFINFERICPE